MENKINLVELLKDCPKGMELDCTMFENLYFDYILKPEDLILCYTEYNNIRTSVTFNKYGAYSGIKQAKCVIFPKGKTNWEGFQRPFKDGEILSNGICICLYNGNENDQYYGCYVGVGHIDYPNYFISQSQNSYFTKKNSRLATEEERKKLFKAIKDNGYRWDEETKTLNKLIEPKFKVGDKIKKKCIDNIYAIEIVKVGEIIYSFKNGGFQYIETVDKEYELIPNKFDISTLKPFDKVLTRANDNDTWVCNLYSHRIEDYCVILNAELAQQCIPYENNKHLLGKTDNCDDFYKTWE